MPRKAIKFEWDKGNSQKNKLKHRVTNNEVEEVFFDKNKREYPDPTHSASESRKFLVGATKKGRILFIVYTTRINYVRVISARDLNKRKEKRLYEKAT